MADRRQRREDEIIDAIASRGISRDEAEEQRRQRERERILARVASRDQNQTRIDTLREQINNLTSRIQLQTNEMGMRFRENTIQIP